MKFITKTKGSNSNDNDLTITCTGKGNSKAYRFSFSKSTLRRMGCGKYLAFAFEEGRLYIMGASENIGWKLTKKENGSRYYLQASISNFKSTENLIGNYAIKFDHFKELFYID